MAESTGEDMWTEDDRRILEDCIEKVANNELLDASCTNVKNSARLIQCSAFPHPHVVPVIQHVPSELPENMNIKCYFFYPKYETLDSYLRKPEIPKIPRFTQDLAIQITFDIAVAIDHLHRSIPGRQALFIRHICTKTILIEENDSKFVKARLWLRRPKENAGDGDACDSAEPTQLKSNPEETREEYECECRVKDTNGFIDDWKYLAEVVDVMLSRLRNDTSPSDQLEELENLKTLWSEYKKMPDKIGHNLEYPVAEPVYNLWDIMQEYGITERQKPVDGKCIACLKEKPNIWTKSPNGCHGCKFYCIECYSINIHTLLCPKHYFTGPVIGGTKAYVLLFVGCGWDDGKDEWQGNKLKTFCKQMKNVLSHQRVCNIPLKNVRLISLYREAVDQDIHGSPDECGCDPRKLMKKAVDDFTKEQHDVKFLWIIYIGHGKQATLSKNEPTGESDSGDQSVGYNWIPHPVRGDSDYLQIRAQDREEMVQKLKDELHPNVPPIIWLPICCSSQLESIINNTLPGMSTSSGGKPISAEPAVAFHLQLFLLGCSKDCKNDSWTNLRKKMPHGVVCGKIVKNTLADNKNKPSDCIVCKKKVYSECSDDRQERMPDIEIMTDECPCQPRSATDVSDGSNKEPCSAPLALLSKAVPDYKVFRHHKDKGRPVTLDWEWILSLQDRSQADEHRVDVNAAKGLLGESDKISVVFLKDGVYSRFALAWEYELQEHINRECLYYLSDQTFRVTLVFGEEELPVKIPSQLWNGFKGSASRFPDTFMLLIYMIVHQHEDYVLLSLEECPKGKCVRNFLEAIGVQSDELAVINDNSEKDHLVAWINWHQILQSFQSLCAKEEIIEKRLKFLATERNDICVSKCCTDDACRNIVVGNGRRVLEPVCPYNTSQNDDAGPTTEMNSPQE